MNALIMAIQLIFGLSILVVIHELGHFLAARAFGIKVEKFYLFFDAWGVKLFKYHYKGCEYGIGWLPLGGYVKIAGMIDESLDVAQLKTEPQEWEFRAKPAWQRLIVMLGGIVANIITGVVIFWMLVFAYGQTHTPMSSLKHGIVPGEIGKKMGFKSGDNIIAVGGQEMKYFDDLLSSKVFVTSNQYITVLRDGKLLNLTVPSDIMNQIADYGIAEFITFRTTFAVEDVAPRSNAQKAGLQKGDIITAVDSNQIQFFDEFQRVLQQNKDKNIELSVLRNQKHLTLYARVNSEGKLGFMPDIKMPNTETIKYGLLASLPIGTSKAFGVLTDNLKGLKKIITGEIKATKALNSPIGIAKVYGASFDWVRFWSITALISMALALMNILPIPALDGGHVVFLTIEIIRGKPLNDKVLEYAQVVGMVILMALMLFTVGNDLWKIFIG